MGATASLDRSPLVVDPGGEVRAELRVRNNGAVVDQFHFEALGAGAAWISVEPEQVSLFPGAEETVTVFFRPPRAAATPPGATPFGVKVVSREDPDGSCVEEGSLTVGTFAERTVELFPMTARGRRSGRFELAIDNRGNSPIVVELTASDAEDACGYRFSTTSERIEPGAARFVKLRVAPRKRFWKGPPKTHQFQVVVSERAPSAEPAFAQGAIDGWAPPGATSVETSAAAATPAPGGAVAVVEAPAPPVTETEPAPIAAPEVVNGTLLQEALVPPWLVKAILITLAALLVLWILWQTLFKSTVQSAARDAVEEPIAELQAQVDQVAPTTVPTGAETGTGQQTGTGADTGSGEQTGTGTDQGTGSQTGTGSDPGGQTTATTAPPFATPFGNPDDFQLGNGSSVPAGSTQTFNEAFQAQFSLTDLVFQNPAGDTGRITVSRDGDVLFTSALENFRDLDQHFVAPYTFAAGESLVMNVTCTTPGPGGAGCTVSASFAGFTK